MARTVDNGYGAPHPATRQEWAPVVATGTVICWRCGEAIVPDFSIRGHGWDLGHDDENRARYQGPEHVACNRGKRQPIGVGQTSRDW